MKRKPFDRRSALSSLRLSFALALATVLPLLLFAGAPSWWTQRGVLVTDVTPDDYAPVNQGQLKNIARAAAAEMDAKLPGGAGPGLHTLINVWISPNAAANDFAPVNLGQIKTVAKPFYDRLIAEGVVDFYPWISSLDSSEDFAVANIGQVKNLFSFEIRVNSLNDSLQNRLAAGQRSGNLALEASAVWFWSNSPAVVSSFQNTSPVRLTELPGIKSVSAGDDHLVLLTESGTVLTWGKNDLGQLGDGTNVDRDAPIAVPNLASIVSVKAGATYTLALQQDGTVLAWGENYYGQLGNGDNAASSSPVHVVGLSSVRKIAAGAYRGAALKEDGTVWTWGYDHYANGRDISNNTPVQVSDLTDIIDIAVGYEHVVALKANGTVWAWGSNYSNQIGNGAPAGAFIASPVQVPNLANVVKVVSKFDHSLAILSDGTLWAWGENSLGQLGDGTTLRRARPVQVGGLSGVIDAATNYKYSLVMKADGTVWSWGEGSSGTVPGVDLRVPQQVGFGVFDTNHNGLDDRWELAYFGNLDQTANGDFDGDGISNFQELARGTDPHDYFNGVAPIIEVAGGNNQVGEAGTFLSKPLKVRLRNTAGQLLGNAPVRFTVTGGAGALASSLSGPQAQSLVARTDTNGEAVAYHSLPNAPGSSTRTVAIAEGSAASAPVTFRGVVRFSLPPTPTPSATSPPDPNNSPTPTPSPSASPVAPYRYAIIDLGKDRYPKRINNQGQILIVGNDDNGVWGSFRWKGGVMERLTYAGMTDLPPVADMNDQGVAVGSFSHFAPWVNGAENEREAGLTWPADSSEGIKTSAPLAVPSWAFNSFGTVKQAFFSAISNNNDVFGGVRTSGGYEPIFHNEFSVYNAYRWTVGTAATQLSFAAATFNQASGKFAFSGAIDEISRANRDGHYIGTKFFPQRVFPNPAVLEGTRTGMIDGATVSFTPRDINEEGIVVGSTDTDMVIYFSPTNQITISGAGAGTINNHTRPAPSSEPQSFPSTSPSPTPIPAPQILGWSGSVNVIWELQPDGHTWHPFGLEEMIPSMEGWDYIEPYDMNDTGAIVGRGWYTDPLTPGVQGEYHAFLLVPAELMVDGNRDGEMSFDDPAVHQADQTSEEKPYRFWVNDDDDGAAGDPGEHVPASTPDYADGTIRSLRDLEDFSRLHVNVAGFEAGLESGSIKAAFEWEQTANSPRIKLYRAASGGTDYLTSEPKASATLLFPFRDTIGEVVPGVPFFIPQDFWVSKSFISNVPKTLPIAWFLFEASGQGKGQLVVSFWKNGQRIGESLRTWLDLRSIKTMYERFDISGNNQWGPVAYERPPDEAKQVLVFVHGWRLSPEGASNFSETMFKRVWWQGFKGEFAAVRWNTYWTSVFEEVPGVGQAVNAFLSRYDDSEHNAWYAGAGLQGVVASLPATYQKTLVAHSMGNIVAASGFISGMRVSNYALLNAAVPAGVYDDSTQLQQSPTTRAYPVGIVPIWNARTPDDDDGAITRGLAYRGRLRSTEASVVSFHLDTDRATVYAWEFNNSLKPDSGFFYSRSEVDGSRIWKNENGIRRSLTEPFEAMPYADQSWSKCAGADGRTRGVIDDAVDLNAGFAFQDEHSAEFNLNIQRVAPFCRELLRRLDLSQNP
jgi:alpha-tubulin suppressor-like RCC1 family protein